MVNYFANELWAKFCRHPEIFKDEVFQTFIPKWVECALKKVSLSQWSWAVSRREKKCQLSSLNTKVFTLPKGQNKPLIKIFYLAVFILVTDLQFSLE